MSSTSDKSCNKKESGISKSNDDDDDDDVCDVNNKLLIFNIRPYQRVPIAVKRAVVII